MHSYRDILQKSHRKLCSVLHDRRSSSHRAVNNENVVSLVLSIINLFIYFWIGSQFSRYRPSIPIVDIMHIIISDFC